MRDMFGTTVASSSNCFGDESSDEPASPVMLPPGCARLATRPFPDRIGRESHDDGDRGDRLLQHRQRRTHGCDDDVKLQSHELRSNFRNSLVVFLHGAPLYDVILSIDIAVLTPTLQERVVKTGNSRARCSGEKPDAPDFSGLLRPRRDRPRRNRAAEKRDEDLQIAQRRSANLLQRCAYQAAPGSPAAAADAVVVSG